MPLRNATAIGPRLTLVVWSFGVVLAIGCGDGGKGRELQTSNLRLLAAMYSQYLGAHGGEAPDNAEALRAFIEAQGNGVLERAGLSGIDALFTSSRDGQPFVVKYKGASWPYPDAIAYEQTGADATRHIATALGGVAEITEEEFARRLDTQSRAK